MSHQLKKEIGPFGLLFMSFTAIFGSGWLFAPFFAAQIAGPGAMIAWLLGAVMSAVVGITMAEVIILFPKAGGLNTVIQMTHGKLIGFLANILMLVVYIILPALEVRAITQYAGSQSAILMTDDHQITLLGYVFAGFLLLVINWVNIYGAKLTARLNSLSVIFKLIAPLAICVFFLLALKQSGHLNNAHLHPFMPIKWHEIFLAISTSGIIFSYNGFNQATLFAAEAKNPQKSIPFAILGSIFFSALLYLLIQYVFLMALPKSAIAHGWSALQFTGDSGPFSGLAALLGLHWLLYLIYTDAVVSPLGTAFTYASAAPRLFYALAVNSHSFPALQKLNSKGIPFQAVILSMILSLAAFILLPNLKIMISILVAAFVLNYTIAPISLLALRKNLPDLPRVFKVPLPSLFCFLSLLCSQLMAYCCGFTPLRNLLIVIVITYMAGCLFLFRAKSEDFSAVKNAGWFVLQAAALTLIAYLSEIQAISFGGALFGICVSCCFVMFISWQGTGAGYAAGGQVVSSLPIE